ncbi:MAG: hypothetical protein WD772_00115, partial [Pseudohongiellaceae bacterium]
VNRTGVLMKLQCWKCGNILKDIIMPFSRYEECNVCKADQHVCRMCREYDPGVADECREHRAEFVLDKEKANFCDFFRPRAKAFQKKDDTAANAARARLAELFGESRDPKETEEATTPQSEADRALAELKRLFGDDSHQA